MLKSSLISFETNHDAVKRLYIKTHLHPWYPLVNNIKMKGTHTHTPSLSLRMLVKSSTNL